MKRKVFSLLFLVGCVFAVGAADATTHDFYKGKTITIVVGFTPGGTYDVWARTLAQHLGKHIPGNPNLIVQNMAGAGSMVAANYVYGVAKPDGLTLATFTPSLYIEQLTGRKEVQYDWAKFTWVGNPERTDRIFYMRADTPYKTLEDIRKAAEPPRCGATGAGTASHYFPKLIGEALDLKFNVVFGYGGSSDVNLAIEKGEVHCWGGTVQAFFGSEPGRTWAKTGFVRVLLQGGRERDPRLRDVPTFWELMDKHRTSEATRRLARVLLAPDDLGRPYAGPPRIPAERVKALREAFMKALADPQLLAEAKQKKLDVNPANGEELEAMAKEVITQPPEVVEQVKRILSK